MPKGLIKKTVVGMDKSNRRRWMRGWLEYFQDNTSGGESEFASLLLKTEKRELVFRPPR